MDQRALWLSSTFAAAKIALALWGAQLTLLTLDRRRAVLGWQICLAVLTLGASWWTMPTSGAQSWWRGAWLAVAILSAAVLVDCLRRWLSSAGTELVTWRVHSLLAWSGWIVAATTTAVAVALRLPPGWFPRAAALFDLISCAGLLGIAIAVSLELTLGALGQGLLQLEWRAVARWASLCWAIQLALNLLVIFSGRASESPLEAAAPFLFAFGMMVVGFIAWSIPRRMVELARRGAVEGQVSLALAGWLAVICLTIACWLPPAWPWNQLGKASARLATLAVVEQ